MGGPPRIATLIPPPRGTPHRCRLLSSESGSFEPVSSPFPRAKETNPRASGGIAATNFHNKLTKRDSFSKGAAECNGAVTVCCLIFAHPSLAGPRLRESGRSAILSGWRRVGGAWAGIREPRDRTPKRDRRTVSEHALGPPLPFRVDTQRLLVLRTCSAWAGRPTLVAAYG